MRARHEVDIINPCSCASHCRIAGEEDRHVQSDEQVVTHILQNHLWRTLPHSVGGERQTGRNFAAHALGEALPHQGLQHS